MPKSTLEMGGALASHLTRSQAARLLGVTPSAVSQRVHSGTLPVVEILGVEMIPTAAVLAVGDLQAPVATASDSLLQVVSQAATALASGEGDKPLFTPSDLAGVYLGMSRLPWPPPPPASQGNHE